MEPDDLLCSRNARPQKDGEGAARCPSCSQNAHGEKDGKDTHCWSCAPGTRALRRASFDGRT